MSHSKERCAECGKVYSPRAGRRIYKYLGRMVCNFCRFELIPATNKGFCPEQDRLDEIAELSGLEADYRSR